MNAWFGAYDKLSMAELYLTRRHAWDPARDLDRVIYARGFPQRRADVRPLPALRGGRQCPALPVPHEIPSRLRHLESPRPGLCGGGGSPAEPARNGVSGSPW
ncbi:MAG: hypothetical protein MZV70_69615 [Desulfobacterales bacterium]|nr:hypothetical protein [Desulfobacterales bacterium]